MCRRVLFWLVTVHSALLLTSGGHIEATKLAIGSNYRHPVTLKYKEIEEIYQTKKLTNHLREIYVH